MNGHQHSRLEKDLKGDRYEKTQAKAVRLLLRARCDIENTPIWKENEGSS